MKPSARWPGYFYSAELSGPDHPDLPPLPPGFTWQGTELNRPAATCEYWLRLPNRPGEGM